MTQFKVGDRVKLIRDGGAWCHSNIGKEGVITPRQGKDYSYVDVTFDNSGGETWEHDYGNPDHLDLVSTITTPPATIQHEGYNYTRGEPVVPEWIKDGAWVVHKKEGEIGQVGSDIYGHCIFLPLNKKFRDCVGNALILEHYRPFTNEDWKWGMWADYQGDKVFVMGAADKDSEFIEVSAKPIDGKNGLSGWSVAHASELTPTTAP